MTTSWAVEENVWHKKFEIKLKIIFMEWVERVTNLKDLGFVF